MVRNLGRTDRTIRIGIGILGIVLLAAGAVAGGLAWVFGVVGVIMLLTASISWCPLYAALGISTNRAVAHRT